jgi:hypothetical protein
MIWKLKALGVGYFSRQGAKSPSSEIYFLLPLRLGSFAGDIPKFDCGSAALGPSW